MATIIWNKNATHLFVQHILYAKQEFGIKTSTKWFSEKERIEKRLTSYPDSYPQERLITKRNIYRGATIMRHFKLIYYYTKSTDIVRIVDIWDMRRNPEFLKSKSL
jgi:hypothetical protein